ncbi:MAG TPA: hypothetical protein VHP38_06260, partial [Ruminiclostridium sp.]|nr:hypothetical protein [Ruminiclostridium sp.]
DDALKEYAKANGLKSVIGKAITITGNGKVGFGADGNPVFGMIQKYEEDGAVNVQDGGYMLLPCDSAALPTVGTDFFVSVNGAGLVKKGAANKYGFVVSVDSKNNLVEILL